MQADTGAVQTIYISAGITKPTFANPCGFKRVGVNPVAIPLNIQSNLTIRIGLEGAGTMAVQDIQFLNMECVEGLYTGRKHVTASGLAKLDPNERDFLVVKPDNMFSLAGLKFLVTGYLPLRAWLVPGVVWLILFGALFAGFLGLNILLRKQWSENERFAFPQIILPRCLFAEEENARGGVFYTLFRNRAMWLGFLITLPLVILKGLHFYNPAVPAPIIESGTFDQYFINPVAKSFFKEVAMDYGWMGAGFKFSLLAIALLIDTNVLFSLWLAFFLFQLWNMFGKIFNWTRFPGYPWKDQQHMGAFIGYALLAVFVARRHLAQVFRAVFSGGDPDAIPQGGERGTYRLALLLVVLSLAVVGWGVWTGMGLKASLLFFSYMLVVGFAASKIRAECGAPFSYITPYYGLQFVAAIGGFAVFGSAGMLVATIASGFMTTASFLLMAPTQIEMMELGRQMNVRPRDVWGGLTLGLLGAVFIGGFTVLCWGYGFGSSQMEYGWPYEQYWWYDRSFKSGEAGADRAFENQTLGTTPEMRPLDVVHNADAKGLGIGLGITGLLALLRSLFMWFPLHPLGYVLAPSYFMGSFWFCALLAWLIRVLLLRIGGARSIREGLMPFCLGMFLACVSSIVIFELVGIYMRMHGVMNIYKALP
jgi:hypothetical protein